MDSFDFAALLQNHEKKHKSRPTQFVSIAGGVRKRLENNIKRRRSSRLTTFDTLRNLSRSDSPKKQLDPLTKLEHRRMQLEKWKEEKERKKQLAAAQKKKPFITGVAHNTLKFEPPPPPPKAKPSTSGRVTRSQTAKNNTVKAKPEKTAVTQTKIQSFAPKNAGFKAPEIKNMTKVPTLALLSKVKKNKETVTFNPVLPPTLKVNAKTKPKPPSKSLRSNVTNKVVNQVEKKVTQGRLTKAVSSSSSHSQESSEDMLSPQPKRTELDMSPETKQPLRNSKTPNIQSSVEILSPEQPQPKFNTPVKPNKIATPRNPIPKSESSSEEKLRSPKSPVDVPFTPLTPEQIVEEAVKNSPFVTMSRGKANARRETMKKIDEGLLDEDASDGDSVDHFRRQLNSEVKRMSEMCDTWDKILEQMVLPENVQELVLGAVGQARLLMSHKLQQFASLVQRCERPEPGHALVTPADLHGFWDMVFMQVVNVDLRFRKLEEMRARDWSEEAPAAPRRKNAPKAKPLAKPATKPAASRLRDVIAAARNAKKQDQAQPQESDSATELAAPARTFEAGFFCVRSPVRSSATPVRPARASMLQAVLSSEAKKSANKHSTSLAMLRASMIGKDVENGSPLAEPTVPLTPINFHATPSRSILKPLNTTSTKKSGKKSIKVVLFDHSDTETPVTSPKNAGSGNLMNGLQTFDDGITDSGVSSMEIEKELKENKSRNKSLVRQDAIEEHSPMMTRSRRKSMPTPMVSENNVTEKTKKRTSRRKKALEEVEVNIVEERHIRKSSSRRKTIVVA